MKKSFLMFVITGLFTYLPIKGQSGNPNEEALIKAVIEGEIKASFNGDYNTWTSFFVHAPYLVWMQAWKDGNSCWKGWQTISSEAKNFVKPERKGTTAFNGNSDYLIRIYDNVAYVSFKCKSTNLFGEKKETEAMEVRFLEKQSGIWRIAYLSSIYLSTY